MIAYFLPSYAMGVLADRVNRKKLLGFGLFINALGYVALAFAPNYACALTAVIVAGVGGSFYHPAATAMVARLYPVGTGRALGLIGHWRERGIFCRADVTRAGARRLLEPLLGAAAWRRPVLELGLLGILAAILFAWLADDETNPRPRERRADPFGGETFPDAAAVAVVSGGRVGVQLARFRRLGHGQSRLVVPAKSPRLRRATRRVWR